MCTITLSEWSKTNNKLIYKIDANRFLHHMVRYLVGTMIQVAKEKISINDFKRLLDNNSNSCTIFKAPAYGLYLKKVYYE